MAGFDQISAGQCTYSARGPYKNDSFAHVYPLSPHMCFVRPIRLLSILDVLDQKQQAAKQARASGSVISNIKSQAAQIQVSMSTKQLFHIPLNRVQLLGMWLCEKA